jgi:hypothetical protein
LADYNGNNIAFSDWIIGHFNHASSAATASSSAPSGATTTYS